MTNPILNICLLQLKQKPENIRLRFSDLTELARQGLKPRMEEYYKTWFEDHSSDDPPFVYDSYNELLDALYYMFNCDIPHHFTGHAMSVSDVIAICEKDGESTRTRYFYVDSIGFKELEDF